MIFSESMEARQDMQTSGRGRGFCEEFRLKARTPTFYWGSLYEPNISGVIGPGFLNQVPTLFLVLVA